MDMVRIAIYPAIMFAVAIAVVTALLLASVLPLIGLEFNLANFFALPILIGILSGVGGDVRFYRTVFP